MFKIRAPYLADILKLEELFKDNFHIKKISSNKLGSLAQSLIPHNLRFLPSIHLAVEEKEILGFVILRCISKPNNCWQIEDVHVLDELRNKGVGEELLRYVLSVYGGYGIEHFLAEIDSENFPTLSLFHECGFRRYAKVCLYEKEIDTGIFHESILLDSDFIIRPQIKNDLAELEKLELSSIPPDLRPALGRSKEYFKEKKNTFVLEDKNRNLVIGWSYIQNVSNDNCLIELILSPGWAHLYEQFLNTIICDFVIIKNNSLKLIVKVNDYHSGLTEVLAKLGFLKSRVKELLVRTIWQKVGERKLKKAAIGLPRAAPT